MALEDRYLRYLSKVWKPPTRLGYEPELRSVYGKSWDLLDDQLIVLAECFITTIHQNILKKTHLLLSLFRSANSVRKQKIDYDFLINRIYVCWLPRNFRCLNAEVLNNEANTERTQPTYIRIITIQISTKLSLFGLHSQAFQTWQIKYLYYLRGGNQGNITEFILH